MSQETYCFLLHQGKLGCRCTLPSWCPRVDTAVITSYHKFLVNCRLVTALWCLLGPCSVCRQWPWATSHQLVVKIGNCTIEFRCSLLLLSASLEKCALSFELDRKKLSFNHEWVSADNLRYAGDRPVGFDGDGEFNFKEYSTRYWNILFPPPSRLFKVGTRLQMYSPVLMSQSWHCRHR